MWFFFPLRQASTSPASPRRRQRGPWTFLIWGASLGGLLVGSYGWQRAIAQAPAPSSPMTVRSDIQEANSQTGVVTARGNVQVYYPARKMQATATQAQYYSRERRLVLSGNVYVLQEGNSMRAETMTYLVDEGRFVANPQANQQVESIYLVEETQEGGNAGSNPNPAVVPDDGLPALPPLNPAP